MTSPDNKKLKEAYDHLHGKYGSFPFAKDDYEPFINDILQEAAQEGDPDNKGDLDLLCDAWIADMKEYEEDKDLVDGFADEDWDKYVDGDGREEME